MPFNLIPSPKSVLGLATSVRTLILQLVRGHREEKTGTQLNQVINQERVLEAEHLPVVSPLHHSL